MKNLESLIDYFKDMAAYYTARINYYNEQKKYRSDKGLKHSEVDKLHRLKSIATIRFYACDINFLLQI